MCILYILQRVSHVRRLSRKQKLFCACISVLSRKEQISHLYHVACKARLKGRIGFCFRWVLLNWSSSLVPCMRSGFSVTDWNYLEGKDCSSFRFRKSKGLAAWKQSFRSLLIYLSPRKSSFRRRSVLLKWGGWEIWDVIFERELHAKLVVDHFSFEHRPKKNYDFPV